MGAIPDFSTEKIAAAAAGDQNTLDELAQALTAPVYYFCLAMLKNSQQAEDAAQEVLVKLLTSLKQFRGQSAFSSWVYSVTSNHCLDLLRKNTRRAEVSLETACASGFEPGLPSESAASDARMMIEAALEKLSPEHRAVLTMRELAGLSYEEIAGALNCSEGTVKSRLFRAREELRAALGSEHEAETEGVNSMAEGTFKVPEPSY